jgi:hypothetical protein
MGEALRFFRQYEYVLYSILAIGTGIYLGKFFKAWQDIRSARFGLERDSGQRRLNQAAVGLFILFVIAGVLFSLITFVEPMLPVAALVPTATLDLLVTPGAQEVNQAPDELTDEFATATSLPTVGVIEEGCVPGEIEITSPKPDEVISGEVDVYGTVDIPEFGFFKFEVARAEEELWLTIQAKRSIVRDGALVEGWDTSRLPPGLYMLQVVVTDNSGEALPPCRVPVRIGSPE